MTTNSNDDGRLRELLGIAGWVVALGIIEAFKPSHLGLVVSVIVIGVVNYLIPPRPKTPFFLYALLLSAFALSYANKDRLWESVRHIL
jgi:hypothetical protein